MTGTVSFQAGRVAVVTLRRPERRNALNEAMLEGLHTALSAAGRDPQTRCVLLQGEGTHFCAGADFGDVAATAEQGARYGGAFESLLRALEAHVLPVVAAVQGAALGAGCQILAACDLSVATEEAMIGIPSARLGLLLDLEKIERMTRCVGLATVRQMLLAGRAFTGTEAAGRGLVTQAVPAARLQATVTELCEQVAACAPLSVRGSKAAIRAILDHGALNRASHEDAFAGHDRRAVAALQSEDLREGLAALRDRRAPDFRGR